MKISINKNSELIIAADIGGTNIRVCLVNSQGEILERKKISCNPSLGIEKVGKNISEMVYSIIGHQEVKGMGYSSAGPINQISGEYINPPNLTGWHKKSLVPILKKHLAIDPKVGHDATLAALAETKFGNYKGSKNLIYLTVSTGVGAGIISNGNMIQGQNWFAGEVGHIIINPNGYKCSIGCYGCLEGNISGTAIASIAREKIAKGEKSNLLNKHKESEINSKLILDYAHKGDKFSGNIINHVIDNLGKGLASILAILNPEVIILGGSVAEGLSQFYWKDILDRTSHYAIPFYKKNPPIKMTALGDDASILGASIIV